MLHGVRCCLGVCVSGCVCVCWQIRESATENSCRCSADAWVFLVGWYEESMNLNYFFILYVFGGNEARFWLAGVARTLKNGSGLGRTSHKGWIPRRECLFPSPICFVLRPFQFVYIWPWLERDSLLIYCFDFLRGPLRACKPLPTAHPPFLGLAMTSTSNQPPGCWFLKRHPSV